MSWQIIQQEYNSFGQTSLVDVLPVKIPFDVFNEETGEKETKWALVSMKMLIKSPKGLVWTLSYSVRHGTFTVIYPEFTVKLTDFGKGHWHNQPVEKRTQNKETAMSLRAFADFLTGRKMPVVQILRAFQARIEGRKVG